MYQMLGFPGCMGSADATHVWWDRCPVSVVSQAKGKEGYPTLGFFTIVNHHKYIQYCSNGYFGATNDKTIAHVEEICIALRRGVCNSIHYQLMDADGLLMACHGKLS